MYPSLQIVFPYKPVICQARDKVWPDMQPLWSDKKRRENDTYPQICWTNVWWPALICRLVYQFTIDEWQATIKHSGIDPQQVATLSKWAPKITLGAPPTAQVVCHAAGQHFKLSLTHSSTDNHKDISIMPLTWGKILQNLIGLGQSFSLTSFRNTYMSLLQVSQVVIHR